MSERPWGFFEILAERAEFKVKRILVRGGHRLSLQRHKQRREHWHIISGEGVVTLNGTEHQLGTGDGIDIPIGALHRIHNPGSADLVFIEIQTGIYFGEDDIERVSDDYNRVG